MSRIVCKLAIWDEYSGLAEVISKSTNTVTVKWLLCNKIHCWVKDAVELYAKEITYSSEDIAEFVVIGNMSISIIEEIRVIAQKLAWANAEEQEVLYGDRV